MFIPKWLLALIGLIFIGLGTWTFLLVFDRNPLPFPDRGSRIFSASSPSAKDAVVELLSQHGINERFQANSSGILRSIMWDGTIINQAPPEVLEKLGGAAASIVSSLTIRRRVPIARPSFYVRGVSRPRSFSMRNLHCR
jgi:hypothetical protein